MKKNRLAALLVGCALAAACYDLDVSAIQPVAGTTYTRQEIIASPLLLERVVAGSFVSFWSGVGHESPWTILGIYGEELTTSVTTFSSRIYEFISEPRGPLENNLGTVNNTAKNPWTFFYESNALATEFAGIIKRENIRIIDPGTNLDNTDRLLAFAKWMQGLSHVHLGLLFDSAAIVGENVDLSRPVALPLAPYSEVLDSGIKWLEESIVLASEHSFAFPLNEGQWVYRVAFDNQSLKAVAHAYIARALAYGARTPEERAAVDWNRVKTHLAEATTIPFGPRGFPDNSFVSMLYRRATTAAPQNINSICGGNCSGAGLMRVDTRIVGPGDTSGVYQEWLDKVSRAGWDTVGPITIQTPDERIQEAGSTTPAFKPAYFKVTNLLPRPQEQDITIRPIYYQSYYWNSTRALDNRTQFPATGGGANEAENADLGAIQDAMMLPVELDLLMAEAHIRSTPPNLTEAARLINKSREINGGLPAVTEAGVPASVPGEPCVPRIASGACGSLMEALMYEKRIETYGTGIVFFDARGWGCLLEGTPTQLAPPGSQLDIMGKAIYTYGGNPGQVGSAPKPTNCPLLFKP